MKYRKLYFKHDIIECIKEGGAVMANKEQRSNKNIKKVAQLTLKEKRALKREKRANKNY